MSKPKYFYTLDDKTIAYADTPACLTINQEMRGTERLVFLDRDAMLGLRAAIDSLLEAAPIETRRADTPESESVAKP